ncbi:MAG: hypothetical protein ACRD5M_05070 [Candidatus Acidiferrales bacterium]
MHSTGTQSVMVATFSTEERSGWFCPGLVNFLNNAVALSRTQNRQTCFFPVYNHRPIDSARNHAAREFLKTPLDWLLMVDNDVAPPLNFLDLVDGADERMDVVVPLCVVFYNNELHFACDANDGQRDGSWFETKFAGTGAMFVRRRVFEKITPPRGSGLAIHRKEFPSPPRMNSSRSAWSRQDFGFGRTPTSMPIISGRLISVGSLNLCGMPKGRLRQYQLEYDDN